MKLVEFFENTYRPLRLVGCSRENRRQYRIQLRHFARFLGREPELGDLTDPQVAAFFDWLLEGRSPATVNKARNHLLALWRLAAAKRLVDEWPSLRMLPEPERVPEAWTLDQLAALFGACARAQGRVAGIPASDYWTAFHHVAFDTGERTGALLALEWAWLDRNDGWLTVPAHVRKGSRKAMAYRLRPLALDAVNRIVEPERRLIFPWRATLDRFYASYTGLLKSAGLPCDRRSKPQRMRRSFASHLEAAGGDATAALGHSSRRVTERSYLDPRIIRRPPPNLLLPEIRVNRNAPEC